LTVTTLGVGVMEAEKISSVTGSIVELPAEI